MLLQRFKSWLKALRDFPKRYLSPRMYDVLTLVLLSSALVIGAYYWPSYAIIAGIAGMVSAVIGEWYCLSKFKQHIFQKIPRYFWEQDNLAFYDKADKNTLTLQEATYYLARRWFRPSCDFALGYRDSRLKIDSVLHFAARHGRADLIKLYLQNGGSLKDKNLMDQTPLYCAVAAKQSSVLSLLAADPEVLHEADKISQSTVLHLACDLGDVDSVTVLCGLGADLFKEDKFGTTPYDNIFFNPSLRLIRFLVETLKVDLARPIKNSKTYPLHLLVRLDNVECISYVLAHLKQEAVNLENSEGLTPRDIAHLYYFATAEKLLAEKGGKLTCTEQGFKRLRLQQLKWAQQLAQMLDAQENRDTAADRAATNDQTVHESTSSTSWVSASKASSIRQA